MDEPLYTDLAPWWSLLSPPEDYDEEALYTLAIFSQALGMPAPALLELGSGAGQLAIHLPPEMEVVLCDISEPMLAQSRRVNPQRQHLRADLRELRLERRFDAVLVHDVVMYMLSEQDLRRAMETAFFHLRPGGVALFVPDLLADEFEEGTALGGGEGPDGRAARLMEWRQDPDPSDHLFQVDFSLQLRHPDGRVEHRHEQHQMAMYSHETWLRLLAEVGFQLLPAPEIEGMPPRLQFLVRRPQ